MNARLSIRAPLLRPQSFKQSPIHNACFGVAGKPPSTINSQSTEANTVSYFCTIFIPHSSPANADGGCGRKSRKGREFEFRRQSTGANILSRARRVKRPGSAVIDDRIGQIRPLIMPRIPDRRPGGSARRGRGRAQALRRRSARPNPGLEPRRARIEARVARSATCGRHRGLSRGRSKAARYYLSWTYSRYWLLRLA
jgi:hypothetical protein